MAHQPKSPSLIVLQKDLVAMLATHRKLILEWEEDGLPVKVVAGEKRYDLYRVLPWLRERWVGESREGDSDRSEALEEWRKAKAEREKLALAKDRNEVIGTDIAAAFWMDRVTAARTAMQSLGQSIAAACVGRDAVEIKRLIDERCRQICDELGRTGLDGLTDQDDSTDDDATQDE